MTIQDFFILLIGVGFGVCFGVYLWLLVRVHDRLNGNKR